MQLRFAPKQAAALFALCWSVFFCSYLGRLNYTCVTPEIINLGIVSVTQSGLLNTVFFFTYASGQLINGIIGDRFSPGKMILIGMVGLAVSNFIFGLVDAYLLMMVLRGLTGYFASMLWPPIMRVFADSMVEEDQVKYSIHMNSSVALGTLAAYLLNAAILKVSSWQLAFFIPSLLLLLMALVWAFGYKKLYAWLPALGKMPQADGAPGKQEIVKQISFKKMLLVPGVLVVLLPAIIHGVLKDGVSSFVPVYITETFFTTPSFALVVSTVLPIINLIGALGAQWALKYISSNEILVSALLFLVSAVALLFMAIFPASSIVLSLAVLAIVTSLMLAVNTLFISILPLRFAPYGRVSTLSGFLNAVAYGGSAISTAVIGFTVENYGWSISIWSWAAITLLAFIICLAGSKASRAPSI